MRWAAITYRYVVTCWRVKPTTVSEASLTIDNFASSQGWTRSVSEASFSLHFSKAKETFNVQLTVAFLLRLITRRLLSCACDSKAPGINRRQKFIIPRDCCSFFTDIGLLYTLFQMRTHQTVDENRLKLMQVPIVSATIIHFVVSECCWLPPITMHDAVRSHLT